MIAHFGLSMVRLSTNRRHLVQLADDVAAEGGQLRVVAIVSQDDVDTVGLRRDPLDGRFDDDSELSPGQVLSRRDDRLEAVAAVIERRQASLISLDSALDTQSLLERVSEAELLV